MRHKKLPSWQRTCLAFILAVVLGSCHGIKSEFKRNEGKPNQAAPPEPDHPPDSDATPPDPVVPPDNLADLQALALELLTTQCASCHAGDKNSGNINYINDVEQLVQNNLVVPKNPGGSPLYTSMIREIKRMPLGGPAVSNVDIIRRWIVAMPDRPPPVPPPVPDDLDTLQSLALQLLDQKCALCHANGADRGGVAGITNVAELLRQALIIPGQPEQSRLFTSMTRSENRMPKDGPSLGDSIEIFRKWIVKLPPTPPPPPPPPPDPIPPEVPREALGFLTPEQVVGIFKVGFQYAQRVTPGLYTALGGANYRTFPLRQRIPQPQALLMVQAIAGNAADGIVKRDRQRELADQSRYVFKIASLVQDRPAPNPLASLADDERAREQRWVKQVRDVYLRAYGRSPVESETNAIRATFLTVLADKPENIPKAWTAVLYALFSSLEFWNA